MLKATTIWTYRPVVSAQSVSPSLDEFPAEHAESRPAISFSPDLKSDRGRPCEWRVVMCCQAEITTALVAIVATTTCHGSGLNSGRFYCYGVLEAIPYLSLSFLYLSMMPFDILRRTQLGSQIHISDSVKFSHRNYATLLT